MNRRVRSVQLQVGGAPAPDTYFDKVVKYIPTDIVAAWIAVNSMVKAATGVPATTVMWIALLFGLFLTAAWTWKQTSASGAPIATKQIIIATAAFAVWVFALGTPFDSLNFYHPLYASLLLIAYTLAVGLIDQ